MEETLLIILLSFVGLMMMNPAVALDYPNRHIRLVVPWPPGGGIDITARAISPKLTENLGQSVIIDNRPGAAGMIGTDAAARAAPDGYTLILGAAGPHAILPLLNPKCPYGLKEFDEVIHFADTFYVMVVNPSLPINTVEQLIQAAKLKPGELTIGSSGSATPAFISGELFRVRSGVNLNPVFYKGAGTPVLEVMGGQISMTIETISPILPYVQSKKLRALAMTASQRSNQIPTVPTFAESGFPGFEVVNWYGILVPAKTPSTIIQRLNKELTSLIKIPEVHDRLVGFGLEVFTSTAEEFTKFRKLDMVKWAKIIKDINLQYQ